MKSALSPLAGTSMVNGRPAVDPAIVRRALETGMRDILPAFESSSPAAEPDAPAPERHLDHVPSWAPAAPAPGR